MSQCEFYGTPRGESTDRTSSKILFLAKDEGHGTEFRENVRTVSEVEVQKYQLTRPATAPASTDGMLGGSVN